MKEGQERGRKSTLKGQLDGARSAKPLDIISGMPREDVVSSSCLTVDALMTAYLLPYIAMSSLGE
jgi:hypothetical protein